MPRRMNQTQRFNRLESAKARVERDVESRVNLILKGGWHRFYPMVMRFQKQAIPHDEKMFWESFQRDLEKAIEESLKQGTGILLNVEGEYADSNNIPFDRDAILQGVNAQLGTRIKNIDLTGTTFDNVDRLIREWYTTDAGLQDLIEKLSPWFSPDRARTIGITETTRLASNIAQNVMRDAGLTRWKWANREDGLVCPECEELGNPANTYTLNDDMPPAHPNCRCGVITLELDETGNEVETEQE